MCKFMPARQQNSPRHGCCIACPWQVVFASLEESLRMMRSLLGDTDHPNMAATLSALGKLYLQAGDIAKAKENLEESLRMTQSLISGTCHPDSCHIACPWQVVLARWRRHKSTELFGRITAHDPALASRHR